jgi:hypothetical protein
MADLHDVAMVAQHGSMWRSVATCKWQDGHGAMQQHACSGSSSERTHAAARAARARSAALLRRLNKAPDPGDRERLERASEEEAVVDDVVVKDVEQREPDVGDKGHAADEPGAASDGSHGLLLNMPEAGSVCENRCDTLNHRKHGVNAQQEQHCKPHDGQDVGAALAQVLQRCGVHLQPHALLT